MYRQALVQLSSPELLPPDANEDEVEEEGAYPTLIDTSRFGSPILSLAILHPSNLRSARSMLTGPTRTRAGLQAIPTVRGYVPVLAQTRGKLVSLLSAPRKLLLASKLDELAETFKEGDHGRLEPTVLEEAGDQVG
jgi:hypothetical protein